jgi:hypothetical protein
MGCVLKLSRHLALFLTVGLILVAGLPQICCAITSTNGRSASPCALCRAGECGGCPCCQKNKTGSVPTSRGRDSTLCQQTPLAVSKPAAHFASLNALLPSFDVALGHVFSPTQSEHYLHIVELPSALEPPTLLHLNCALLT